jgi:hypothetical protein
MSSNEEQVLKDLDADVRRLPRIWVHGLFYVRQNDVLDLIRDAKQQEQEVDA